MKPPSRRPDPTRAKHGAGFAAERPHGDFNL